MARYIWIAAALNLGKMPLVDDLGKMLQNHERRQNHEIRQRLLNEYMVSAVEPSLNAALAVLPKLPTRRWKLYRIGRHGRAVPLSILDRARLSLRKY